MNTTHPSLLLRIRNPNDVEAWEKFHDLYGPLLFCYARASGLSHEDAEDIRSACFETIVKQIRTFEYNQDKGGFKAWLRTLVNRRVIDRLRKRRSQLLDSHAMRELSIDDKAADELWDERWRHQHLLYCVEAAKQLVSTQAFEVFELLAQQNLSVPEVCQKLSLNANQVYKGKAQVLRAIRQQMQSLYPEDFD